VPPTAEVNPFGLAFWHKSNNVGAVLPSPSVSIGHQSSNAVTNALDISTRKNQKEREVKNEMLKKKLFEQLGVMLLVVVPTIAVSAMYKEL
jgi:hypothetical protein